MRIDVQIGTVTVDGSTGAIEPKALHGAIADSVTAHLRETRMPGASGDSRAGGRSGIEITALSAQIAAEISKGMSR